MATLTRESTQENPQQEKKPKEIDLIPAPTKTYITRDYKVFVRPDAHRPLNPKKVDVLVASMRKWGYRPEYPITVDHFMRITNGQHRAAAAEIAQVDLHYQFTENSVREDAEISSLQDDWSKQDWLDIGIKEGEDSYLKLAEFRLKYPFITLYKAVELCTSQGHTRTLPLIFKQGLYRVDNLKYAETIAKMLLDFEPFGDRTFYRTKPFIATLEGLYADPNYHHSRMMRKLKGSRGRLMKRQGTTRDYYILMNELYNYREPRERWVTFYQEKPYKRKNHTDLSVQEDPTDKED